MFSVPLSISKEFTISLDLEREFIPVSEERDIFEYGQAPSADLSIVYTAFWDDYAKDGLEMASEYEDTEVINALNTSLCRAATKLPVNPKCIEMVIDYPLSRPASITFTRLSDIKLTYGMLLYMYTAAYQLVYTIEDNSIEELPTTVSKIMINRALSKGPYGIWGHSIYDLVYNGCSVIETDKDGNIRCSFDCDS